MGKEVIEMKGATDMFSGCSKAPNGKIPILPEMTQESIMHIDSTPNDDYPLRILRAYKANCDVKWSDNTTSNENTKPLNPLLQMMNDHCNERATILDDAIKVLENNKMMKDALRKKRSVDENWSSGNANPIEDIKAMMVKAVKE